MNCKLTCLHFQRHGTDKTAGSGIHTVTPEVTLHPSDVCAHILLFIFFMLLILCCTFYEARFILLYSRKAYIHFSYVHYFGATSQNLLTNLKNQFLLSDVMKTQLFLLEFLHADGWTDGQTWPTEQIIFEIFCCELTMNSLNLKICNFNCSLSA